MNDILPAVYSILTSSHNRLMRLNYQVNIIAIIQFITLSLLGIPNALVSIISTCQSSKQDCFSNALVSVMFFLLTVIWFGLIAALAFFAYDRRRRLIILCLAGAELATAAVASFNARHDTNYLTLITSFLDIILSLWVVYLCWRLYRAKGGRIVRSGNRVRQPKKPIRSRPSPDN